MEQQSKKLSAENISLPYTIQEKRLVMILNKFQSEIMLEFKILKKMLQQSKMFEDQTACVDKYRKVNDLAEAVSTKTTTTIQSLYGFESEKFYDVASDNIDFEKSLFQHKGNNKIQETDTAFDNNQPYQCTADEVLKVQILNDDQLFDHQVDESDDALRNNITYDGDMLEDCRSEVAIKMEIEENDSQLQSSYTQPVLSDLSSKKDYGDIVLTSAKADSLPLDSRIDQNKDNLTNMFVNASKDNSIDVKLVNAFANDLNQNELLASQSPTSRLPLFCCKICELFFVEKADFDSHNKLRHNNAANEVLVSNFPSKLFCKLCNAVFFSRDRYSSHIKRHAPKKPSALSKKKRKKASSKDQSCRFCKQKFSSLHLLQLHEKNHERDELISCSVCGYIFSQRGSLKMHMLRKHSKVKPSVKCSICNRSFSTNFSLKRHIKMMHNFTFFEGSKNTGSVTSV